MGRPGRVFTARLALVVLAGVALRTFYLLVVARDVTGVGDWHFFHWQANAIADGLGFVEPYRLRFDGLRLPSAGHPPLYPLLLSGVSVLGGTGELAHRCAGLGLGALTVVLVGLLGRRIGGDRVGLVAAGLTAVYPTMVAVDGALMSETLLSPLIAGVLLMALALNERPALWRAAALGALVGLAALTRAEALGLLVLLALPVAVVGAGARAGAGGGGAGARDRRASAARAALTVVACLAVLAPWTLRNAGAFHRVVVVSDNDATVVAGANCPLTYRGVDLGGWNIACISARRFNDEAEQASVWRSEGRAYAAGHLRRLPVVATVRLLRVWDLWQPRRQVMFAEGRHRRTQQLGVAAYFGLLALSAAGAWRLRRRRAALGVLLAPAVLVCLTAVAGYGVPRLRHPFEIALLVLAAVGVETVIARLGSGRRHRRLRRRRRRAASPA
jgi:4-amino-4-deoxy-L-arabinose transferase-like glycosyltransferase